MVMRTSKNTAQADASYDQEDVSMEAGLLHEQLAAYALNVAGDEQSNRKGVWGEHSYARARGTGSHERVRSLLAAGPRSPPPTDVDVVSVSPEPALPGDTPATPDLDDDDEEDWERRLRALAPSAAYLRLADDALDTLRQLRLERLALPADAGAWARRESARAAARKLRRALAPHWAGPGGGGAGWLHAALTAQLPRGPRALYREMLQELRRAVPRLAARLPLARPLDRVRDPLAALPEPVGPDGDGPWLAWAPSGDEAADRRWTARLGALLHVRRLDADAAPASPERWAAAVGVKARTALERLRAEAGERAVAVGGCGAGAALAMWLGGERLLLLSPPLLTAEGAREPESGSCAALLVVGGRAAGCWRGAAAEVGRRARVLLLHGADDALRLPRRLRRYNRLPQHALDAAIAHACARWLVEERAELRPETPPPPPPMEKGISDDEVSPVSSGSSDARLRRHGVNAATATRAGRHHAAAHRVRRRRAPPPAPPPAPPAPRARQAREATAVTSRSSAPRDHQAREITAVTSRSSAPRDHQAREITAVTSRSSAPRDHQAREATAVTSPSSAPRDHQAREITAVTSRFSAPRDHQAREITAVTSPSSAPRDHQAREATAVTSRSSAPRDRQAREITAVTSRSSAPRDHQAREATAVTSPSSAPRDHQAREITAVTSRSSAPRDHQARKITAVTSRSSAPRDHQAREITAVTSLLLVPAKRRSAVTSGLTYVFIRGRGLGINYDNMARPSELLFQYCEL